MRSVAWLLVLLCLTATVNAQTTAISNPTYQVVQENGAYSLAITWTSDSPTNTFSISGVAGLAGGAPFSLPAAPVTAVETTSTRFEKRYGWGKASATSVPDTVETLVFTIVATNSTSPVATVLPINVPMTKQVIQLLNRPDPSLLPPPPRLSAVVAHKTDSTLRLSVVANGGDATVQATATPTGTPPPGKSYATVLSTPLTLSKGVTSELILRGLSSGVDYSVSVDEISKTYGGHPVEHIVVPVKMSDPVPAPTITLTSLDPTVKEGGVIEISYRTYNAARVLAAIDRIDPSGVRTPVGSGPWALKPSTSPTTDEPATIAAGLKPDVNYLIRLWAEHADRDIPDSAVIETKPVTGLNDTLFTAAAIDLSDDLQLVPQGLTKDSVTLSGTLTVAGIPVKAICTTQKCSFRLNAVQTALKPLLDDKSSPPAGQITLTLVATATDKSGRKTSKDVIFQTTNAVPAKGLSGNSAKIANGVRAAATAAASDPNVNPKVKGVGNFLLALMSMFL